MPTLSICVAHLQAPVAGAKSVTLFVAISLGEAGLLQGWAPHSFKERNVFLRSFFEFLETYETLKNDAFFCVLFLRT